MSNGTAMRRLNKALNVIIAGHKHALAAEEAQDAAATPEIQRARITAVEDKMRREFHEAANAIIKYDEDDGTFDLGSEVSYLINSKIYEFVISIS